MTLRTILIAALAVAPSLNSAYADERIDITPPLYRVEARETAHIRPAADLTTTPTLVPAALEAPRRVVEATAR
ncbi:hypothetical protein [Methylobacterium komagatae]